MSYYDDDYVNTPTPLYKLSQSMGQETTMNMMMMGQPEEVVMMYGRNPNEI